MKFNLHGGKTPREVYATVQDKIAHTVQSRFDQVGLEVTTTIRSLKLHDFKAEKPTKLVYNNPDAIVQVAEDEVNNKTLEEQVSSGCSNNTSINQDYQEPMDW